MSSRFNHRPSPSMIVALFALFVALGGTGYAATRGAGPRPSVVARHKHHKKHHKKHQKSAPSDTSADSTLFNSLSAGAHVAFATGAGSATTANQAGTANQAANATNATNATNANTVGGLQVKHFFMKGPFNTAVAPVLSLDGIVIKAGCDGSAVPLVTIENDSGVGTEYQGVIGGYNNGVAYINSSGLTATPESILGGDTRGSGSLTAARSDGKVVSIQYAADDSSTFGGESVCTVNGTAIAS